MGTQWGSRLRTKRIPHSAINRKFKKNFNVYLFLKKRNRQSVSWGGSEREREGDTESEAGSRLRAVSTEPDAGLELTDHEIMT